MSIAEVDMKFYKSLVVSSDSSNGGGMSYDEAVSGSKNNIWPNVSGQNRLDGIDLYRKIFGAPHSDTDDDFVDPRIWNHSPTDGDDYLYLFAGTKVDTEATINETRKFGCGKLAVDVSMGATSFTVTVENAALTSIFQASDKIRVSNKISPELAGDTEEIQLNSTTPTINGLDVTVYFDVGTTNAYLAINSFISSLYQVSTTSVSVGTIDITSTSGTIDDSNFPPELNNTGTRDEELTVAFTSPTTFTMTGSVSGSLGSAANLTSDFIATNPINGKQIIKLPAGFFTGTYESLDTVVIPTIANNVPFWLKRVVPPASGTLSGNLNISALLGESA